MSHAISLRGALPRQRTKIKTHQEYLMRLIGRDPYLKPSVLAIDLKFNAAVARTALIVTVIVARAAFAKAFGF